MVVYFRNAKHAVWEAESLKQLQWDTVLLTLRSKALHKLCNLFIPYIPTSYQIIKVQDLNSMSIAGQIDPQVDTS